MPCLRYERENPPGMTVCGERAAPLARSVRPVVRRTRLAQVLRPARCAALNNDVDVDILRLSEGDRR